jgi:nicotinate-nucleotide adenylyltransferase
VASIGLLGGTFNPPHIGHLVCAMEARDQLGLDRVQLVPVAVPPHKEAPDDPGVEVRLELCRLAVADDPGLEVSRVEADRPGPSYTADTLRALHEASPEDDLTFIVGGDMAHSLPEWREPEVVLSLARLAVAEREGIRRQDILERLDGLEGAPERIAFFDMPRLDVSSSQLRRRIAAGRPVRHLVPDAVADHIASLGLYRVGATAWA